ncbi:unnamed protein product, partial [Prorocentrum cordatum]
ATREISQQLTEGTGMWWTYANFGTKFLGVAIVVGQIFSFVGMVKKSNYYLIGRSWSCLLGWASILPLMCYLLLTSCRASRGRGDGCLGRLSCWSSDGQRGFICGGTGILFALIMVVFLVCYLLWLCFVELPTYYRRFGDEYEELAPGSAQIQGLKAKPALNGEDLGFVDGLWDALTFRVPTTDWDVWKRVVWWNTICATFGSWFAIFLSTGPCLPERASGGRRPAQVTDRETCGLLRMRVRPGLLPASWQGSWGAKYPALLASVVDRTRGRAGAAASAPRAAPTARTRLKVQAFFLCHAWCVV